MLISRITDMAKLILAEYIEPGDIVVDATLGNGNDTIFMRDLIGDDGFLYAFDVQEVAILHSKEQIPDYKQKNIEFILDGHENMDRYVDKKVKAVVFNLGYLPASDHAIRTSWETTKIAIEKSLDMLLPSGVVSISAYLGHDEGDEYREIHKFFGSIDAKKFKAVEMNPINQNEFAPKLLICQKI